MSRLTDIADFASRHRRLLGGLQLAVLAVFFVIFGWALRGPVHSAGHDLDNANLVYFGLACAALGAYYLVFVFGWMRILAEWGIQISYPAALRALARGGVVVCAGIHMSDIPSFAYELLWHERLVRSVANLTRRDGEEFLALAPQVPVRTEIETFPLEQANEALERLRRGRIRGAAVLRVD